MKKSELKELIKECVTEVFRSELKDILLESLKGSKNSISQPLQEQNMFDKPPSKMTQDMYKSIIEETIKSSTPDPNKKFQVDVNHDPLNDALPEGEVDLNMISKFLGK